MAFKRYVAALVTGSLYAGGPVGLLFLKRNINDEFGAGKWNLPGGSIEKNESPVQAVQRELREETGLSVSVFMLLNVIPITNGEIYYYNAYAGEDELSSCIGLNNEHDNYCIMPWQQSDQLDLLLDTYQHLLKLHGYYFSKAEQDTNVLQQVLSKHKTKLKNNIYGC